MQTTRRLNLFERVVYIYIYISCFVEAIMEHPPSVSANLGDLKVTLWRIQQCFHGGAFNVHQDVIRDILESNGTLNHVKARLRADVFAALQVVHTFKTRLFFCRCSHAVDAGRRSISPHTPRRKRADK